MCQRAKYRKEPSPHLRPASFTHEISGLLWGPDPAIYLEEVEAKFDKLAAGYATASRAKRLRMPCVRSKRPGSET